MPPFLKALFAWFHSDAAAPEAPAAPTAARSEPDQDRSTRPRQARFGRFVAESELGRGAMGAVYKGVDPSTGEPVAIKTIALGGEFSGDDAADARARFQREADTARLLRHPDIVAIRDTGNEGDIAYIAMEFVEGRDLSWYCAPSRLLPEQDAIAIVARIADALAYAHSQGVIHRDIKPANVMVDPDRGVVKVTDFGVARLLDSSRTRSGVVLGTPAYMSPEQMAGGQVDGRSDLYSLGVLLFNLLTGQLPHRATSMAQLMFQIANHAPQDVRSLRPSLSAALADVVTLALEKRPEVRYADGRQFASDLREVAAMLRADSAGPSVTTHNGGVAP